MVSTDDVHQFARRLESERERIQNADIDKRDRELLTKFLVEKDGQVAISSLEQYGQRTRKAARVANTPIVEMGQDDYERLVYRLRHEENLSNAYVRNIENALCILLEDLLDRDWIDDITRTETDDQTVDASEMLEPDDIHELLDACRHQRDVALIEFLADTGARLSLTLSLRIRDLDLEGDQSTYRPNPNAEGLKDADIKPYPIVDSAATLRNYLQGSHPRADEGDAAVFHKIQQFGNCVDDDDGALSPSGVRRQLLRIADRADVDKPVNPHNFRHSAITRMFREGYSRAQIQHRVQWSVDTEMWSRYVHLTAEELNDDIFAAAGVGDEEETTPERAKCGECHEPLAPHHRHCPRCGRAVTPDARDDVEAFAEDGIEALADGDLTASERRIVSTALKKAREDESSVNHADSSSSPSGE